MKYHQQTCNSIFLNIFYKTFEPANKLFLHEVNWKCLQFTVEYWYSLLLCVFVLTYYTYLIIKLDNTSSWIDEVVVLIVMGRTKTKLFFFQNTFRTHLFSVWASYLKVLNYDWSLPQLYIDTQRHWQTSLCRKSMTIWNVPFSHWW